jgi:hypothetical protein
MSPYLRKLVRTFIRRAKQYIGTTPYVEGGLSDPGGLGIDCRGLVRRSANFASILPAYGGGQTNVRGFVAWAKANGRFRDPSWTPTRGALVFYNQPSTTPEPGNPDHIRHVAIVEQPVNPKNPEGKAVSALNPHLGVMEHNLALTNLFTDAGEKPVHFGLAIYGFLDPDWTLVEPPITNPEPPITPA